MSEFEAQASAEEVTRRQWLLILGRLAAITGFSGVLPELVAAVSTARGQQPTALPPGLYYPAEEHLSHALGDTGSVHEVPPGSETDYAQPSSGPFHPKFFSDEELKVVARCVEILLGKVDTVALSQAVQWLDLYLYSSAGVQDAALKIDPLHRTLAIAYYGETAVRELETVDRQAVVRSGIATLQHLSVEQFGRGFLALDESQQMNVVATISSAKAESPLHHFYEVTRTEAIRAYYTSADGLKELDYKGNWYYPTCPGCEHR